MDSSAASIYHFNLSQTHLLALQHCTPRTQTALPLDAHYRLEKLTPLAYPHQLPLMYGFSPLHLLQ